MHSRLSSPCFGPPTITPGAASNPVAFARSADRLRIGATNHFRVEPADARRLAGVYARKSFTNLSGGAGVASGGVAGETAIAFDGATDLKRGN